MDFNRRKLSPLVADTSTLWCHCIAYVGCVSVRRCSTCLVLAARLCYCVASVAESLQLVLDYAAVSLTRVM
ncbi:hypothetical protein U1Q18_023973 [Sarracenia purpurea var. burkii]